MAVGRISGPLLQENLLRNNINLNFKNTVSDTALIHLDVVNGKIAIAGNTGTDDLHVLGTTKGVIFGINNQLDTGDLDFGLGPNGDTISAPVGPINLNSPEAIVLSALQTDNINIDDNIISSYNTNSNIDLLPNGTGTVEVANGLEVFGNLHSTANITADGNITIGNDDEDNLVLNADIATDLIPDQPNTYNIGATGKKWDSINVDTLESATVTAQGVTSGTTSFHVPQGNIFYVAKGGNDTNVGDNMYAPLLTVKQALARADASVQGPVTIYIYPGEYEEIFPLEIPTNVTIAGLDFRNTIIKPTSATNTNNCFLMNGETTVQNLTIKDFYSPGHGFSFASNATVTTRSPYIKNVTVITKGSVISASDPRGFDEGDAGKGALVDGASVLSTSQEASMLFHSVTFITPGVDALTMTNGVRVEWLNSFTYFANRGLYATNGSTGHLSSDGSTTVFGAELRAIGSANVYGNFGAVGDGSGVLFYLIQHNMAYIGLGKNVENDPSQVIQSQEISKANSANIYYQTVDHRGNYRVGDQFFINQDTGETTITITEAEVDSLNGLTLTTNGNTTIIDGEEIRVGEFLIKDNTISSLQGRIDFDSFSGQINLLDNTNVTGNVSMTGDFSIGGSAIGFGNEPGDTIDFNTPFSQNLVPDVSGLYSLGTASKTWSKANLGSIQADDFLFETNYITTTESNSDFELRANGTGKILLPNNNFEITNATTIIGTTTIRDTGITGAVTHVGDRTQTGNNTVTGNVTATGNFVGATNATFEEINFEGNALYTTPADRDLSLRANGIGLVILQENVDITNNLQVGTITSTSNIFTNQDVTAEAYSTGDIFIENNYITTTNSNSNLELRGQGTGHVYLENIGVIDETITTRHGDSTQPDLILTTDANFSVSSTGSIQLPKGTTAQRIATAGNIRFNTDSNSFEGYATDNVFFGGIFSADGQTSITADATANNILLTVNGAIGTTDSTKIVGEINGNGLTIHRLDVDDIYLDNSTIRTSVSNSDLELKRDGTGKAVFGDIKLSSNSFLNDGTGKASFAGSFGLSGTGNPTGLGGWHKFVGGTGIVIPYGDNSTRGSLGIAGEIRWNTDSTVLEVYDGTTDAWIPAAGDIGGVDEEYMEEEGQLWSLLLG